MNKITHPNIRHLESVYDDIQTTAAEIDGEWVPARPITSPQTTVTRIKAAWLVFIGKADALIWPKGQ